MHSQPKFSFKNLQPVTYLKTFNRMIDQQRSSTSQSSRKGLSSKLVTLSKFPIHKDYEHMQGVFQNVAKNKADEMVASNQMQVDQQQKFMKKHCTFMTNVLHKFNDHNENRQKIFEKAKNFYRNKSTSRIQVRTAGQFGKGRSSNKKDKIIIKKEVPKQISENEASKGSQLTVEQKIQLNILPKLEPCGTNKQRLKIRSEKQIQQYILKKKLQKQQSSKGEQQNQATYYKYFQSNQIIDLQKKQAKMQSNFASRIDQEINQFSKRAEMQIHAINYCHFWKEPEYQFRTREKMKEKKNQEDREREVYPEWAQGTFRIGSYATN